MIYVYILYIYIFIFYTLILSYWYIHTYSTCSNWSLSAFLGNLEPKAIEVAYKTFTGYPVGFECRWMGPWIWWRAYLDTENENTQQQDEDAAEIIICHSSWKRNLNFHPSPWLWPSADRMDVLKWLLFTVADHPRMLWSAESIAEITRPGLAGVVTLCFILMPMLIVAPMCLVRCRCPILRRADNCRAGSVDGIHHITHPILIYGNEQSFNIYLTKNSIGFPLLHCAYNLCVIQFSL